MPIQGFYHGRADEQWCTIWFWDAKRFVYIRLSLYPSISIVAGLCKGFCIFRIFNYEKEKKHNTCKKENRKDSALTSSSSRHKTKFDDLDFIDFGFWRLIKIKTNIQLFETKADHFLYFIIDFF